MTAVAFVHPAAQAETEPEPLQRRFAAGFEQMVAIHRIEETVPRLVADFLHRVRIEHHDVALGPLRCALAWQTLPGFLDAQGWTVAGSTGSRCGGDEVDAPDFGRLDLGAQLRLEFPKDLFLFLEQASRRAVLRFEFQTGPWGSAVELTFSGSDDEPPFFDPWFAHAARENVLRGRVLRAGGRLLGQPGLREGEQLFVADAARERLELVARRFDSPLAGRLAGLGVRSRGGVILAGAPGTGKTSLCRELSGKLACTFLWVTPGDLTSEESVREAFELARWLAPTVVVLEDLDLVAESRLRGNRSSVLGQLMSELDGAPGDHAVLTIATTNRLEVVEEALRNRPGRFDQVIEIEPPGDAERRLLIEHRLARCQVDPGDLRWFADRLDGATGAEIEEAANGAIAVALAESDEPGEGAPRLARRHFERSLAWIRRLPERREAGFGAADDRCVSSSRRGS